ncbi:MAG: signal peptide peptidase SppA [Planctomycetota bacterium]|nr:signal peptide peptidase SppA [Planctomycetota bacterium]
MNIFPRSALILFLAFSIALIGGRQSARVLANESTSKTKVTAKEPLQYAVFTLDGALIDGVPSPLPLGGRETTLYGLVQQIDKAAKDQRLHGAIFKIRSPSIGRAKIAEIRAAIARLRKSGKKVFADLEMASTSDYMIASACDEIVMPPAGSLMVTGVRIEVTFYKEMLNKIGAKADILQVGDFKGAGETFTRSEMSPELKKQYESLATDFFDQLITNIASDRELSNERVEQLIDTGLFMAEEAKQNKLIDRVAYQSDWKNFLQQEDQNREVLLLDKYGEKEIDNDFSGFAGMVKFMNLLMGQQKQSTSGKTPQIAVIYVSGAIVPGKSSNTIAGNNVVGSETIIDAVKKAEEESRVKAIVIRVDSPGGSALASDLIWDALRNCKKPVFASMGDVAASGGYYVAMGAKKIFAEEGTLTGSIGVVGGKVALQDTLLKLGITTSVVSRGENSGLFSILKPFSENERAALTAMMKNIYLQFITKAASSRNMDLKQIRPLAEGKVYTGRQAQKIGLVDQMGGLHDAVADAKKECGIAADEKTDLLLLPKPQSFLEELFGSQSLGTTLTASTLDQLPKEWSGYLAEATVLAYLFKYPINTMLPYRITID